MSGRRNEFALLRVPGAVLLPLSTLSTSYEQLPTDRPLLHHVRGRRTKCPRDRLPARERLPDATNVAGGITAWNQAGLAVRTGTPEDGEGDLA